MNGKLVAVGVALIVLFAWLAYAADERSSEIGGRQSALGPAFGCADPEYPLPANTPSGASGCYQVFTCTMWDTPPTCDHGLTLNPSFAAKWTAYRTQYDALHERTFIYTCIALAFGYLLVGWYLHAIVLGIARRFLLPKWALLTSLGVAVAMVNAPGVVRAVVDLLKLPAHEAAKVP